MSDGLDPVVIGTHGGVATLASMIVAGIARMFASRQAEQVAIKLALLEAGVNDMKSELKTLRDRSHEHGNHLTRLLYRTGIEDTDPKRRAPSGP